MLRVLVLAHMIKAKGNRPECPLSMAVPNTLIKRGEMLALILLAMIPIGNLSSSSDEAPAKS